MNYETKNLSYIVNYPDDKHPFGCRRACSYCNWNKLGTEFKESKPDPDLGKKYYHLARTDRTMENKMITISGGGDPLYSNDPDPGRIPFYTIQLIEHSILQGYTVRIITREIYKAYLLLKTHKYASRICFSFSIDATLVRELRECFSREEREEFFKMITVPEIVKREKTFPFRYGTFTVEESIHRQSFEFSIVASSVPTAYKILEDLNSFFLEIVTLELPHHSIHLTIRENLKTTCRFGSHHGAIQGILKRVRYCTPDAIKLRWLPSRVCLQDNRYFIQPMDLFDNKPVLTGTDMSIDYAEIFGYCNAFDGVIYGSAARSFALWEYAINHPDVEPQCASLYSFNDYDVFVPNDKVEKLLDVLTTVERMAIATDRICNSKVWMRVIVLKRKIDPTFKITIHAVTDIEHGIKIISQAGLDIDRLYVQNMKVHELRGFSMRHLIKGVARQLSHGYKYLDKTNRDIAQLMHNRKLYKRGCDILPMRWYHKLMQKVYNRLYK